MEQQVARQSFRYDPIDFNNEKATRFVRIHPENNAGLLNCELWHGEWSTDFIYLTYVRNSSTTEAKACEQISLNGRTRSIDRTLWEFLAVARSKFPGQAFWIDTLCIDLDNDEEQGWLIDQRMKVYILASMVYVWLGPYENYAARAMDILSQEPWHRYRLFREDSADAKSFWIGFSNLLSHKYWNQATTVQEALLPAKIMLLLGDREFPMGDFESKATDISKYLWTDEWAKSSELYASYRSVLEIAGLLPLASLWTSRRTYQNSHRVNQSLAIQRAYCWPPEVPSLLLKACAEQTNNYCPDITDRVVPILSLVESSYYIHQKPGLNPFELFLQCMPWIHQLEDTSTHLDHLARLLDMTPSTVSMYNTKLGENFRIPGEQEMGVASVENRKIHQQSSGSIEQRQKWEETGHRGSVPTYGKQYRSDGLTDLLWINGAGGSNKFAMPERCQWKTAVKYRSTDVYLLIGIHTDGSTSPQGQGSAQTRHPIWTQDISDLEFNDQNSKCCTAFGSYQVAARGPASTVYFAIIDAAAFDEKELESSALEYYASISPVCIDQSKRWKTKDIPRTPLFDAQVNFQESIELVSLNSTVVRIAFSPNGNRLASYSQPSNCLDNTIHIWDTTTGSATHTLTGIEGNCKCIAFSPDGELFAHGSRENELDIVHLSSKRTCRTLITPPKWGQITSIAFSPDGELIATTHAKQAKVHLWNVTDGESPQALDAYGHFAAATAVAFSPDGKLLASGSVDKTLIIWHVAEQRAISRIVGHTGTIVSVAFSADGRLLASASPDRSIRIWDLQAQSTVHVLKGHDDAVSSISFAPEGRRLLSGSDDGTLRVWDINTEETLFKLERHKDAVKSVAFAPSGRLIASASDDGTVRLWGVKMKEIPTYLDYVGGYTRNLTQEAVSLFNAVWRVSGNFHSKTHPGKAVSTNITEDSGCELDEIANTSGRSINTDVSHRRAFSNTEG